jgi:hypothetical protein
MREIWDIEVTSANVVIEFEFEDCWVRVPGKEWEEGLICVCENVVMGGNDGASSGIWDWDESDRGIDNASYVVRELLVNGI